MKQTPTRLAAISLILLTLFSPGKGQTAAEAHLTPGESLVVERIPPIPTSLVKEIERYANTEWATFAAWHPSKREMLVVPVSSGATTRPQLHLVTAPGEKPVQVTTYPTGMSTARWEEAGHLKFARLVPGEKKTRYFRYVLADGKVELIGELAASVTNTKYSQSGDWVAFSVVNSNGADMDVYVGNPLVPNSTRLLAQLPGGFNVVHDWSPDNKHVLVYQHISINRSDLWVVNVETGEKRQLTSPGASGQAAHWSGCFSRDGKGVFLTSDRDSEFQQLYYVELATGRYTPLAPHLKANVGELALAPDGTTLAFTTNENSRDGLYLLDVKRRKITPVKGLPEGLLGGLAWHHNSRDLAFVWTSPRVPNDVFSVDAATGKIERWTHSSTGGYSTENVAYPELIKWKSFDGKVITGFLYHPTEKFKGRRPVIIDIHGGPESQYRPHHRGRDNYYLNELGVAFIHPNVRGSSGLGKSFVQADNGLKREDAVKDIGALLDWIARRPDLDSERVMVRGVSSGGYMALSVAIKYGQRIRAAQSVSGITNILTYLEKTNPKSQALRRVEYGDERDPLVREFLNRTAPVNSAHKISRPLFIAFGGKDPNLPLEQAEEMVKAARSAGVSVWYLFAKDEGHGFVTPKNRDYLYYATVLFVKENLLK